MSNLKKYILYEVQESREGSKGFLLTVSFSFIT